MKMRDFRDSSWQRRTGAGVRLHVTWASPAECRWLQGLLRAMYDMLVAAGSEQVLWPADSMGGPYAIPDGMAAALKWLANDRGDLDVLDTYQGITRLVWHAGPCQIFGRPAQRRVECFVITGDHDCPSAPGEVFSPALSDHPADVDCYQEDMNAILRSGWIIHDLRREVLGQREQQERAKAREAKAETDRRHQRVMTRLAEGGHVKVEYDKDGAPHPVKVRVRKRRKIKVVVEHSEPVEVRERIRVEVKKRDGESAT